ncbi:TPA: LPS translocon maturation chaperone LptM [Photobacterium damselae]
MRKSLVAIFIFTILALTGCGQSGALYMPKDQPDQSQAQ